MSSAPLTAIAAYCDRLLGTTKRRDYDGAVNGLQVQNCGRVHRIAATVDASLATVRLAINAGADLMIVHHGLFWGESHPWTHKRYDLLRLLIDYDVAVYSSHLPLDAHPRVGNNALLCASLGLKKLKPFFFDHEQYVGFQTATRVNREDLGARLEGATGGKPRLLAGGPPVCRRIGVVTGGAGAELRRAVAEGVDTFITGEGPHWTYALAEELELNVFYAGHYATETFGVRALAADLSKRFRIPWSFVDHPTGL